MVRYNKKEINYIIKQFFKTLNDLRNVNTKTGEYKDYLISVAKPHERNMKYILKNFNKINTDKRSNNMTSNIMYCLCGLDILEDTEYNKAKIDVMDINQRYRIICEKIWLDMEFSNLISSVNIIQCFNKV